MNNFDKEMMLRAIALAEQGRITTPPNPWVGCVITQNSQIVGEGFHYAPGSSHAEVIALKQAGDLARSATAYVTLEPCCHFGRTPPCTAALIKAQIKKVFVALRDPDPKVSGQGIKALQEAGIQVELGLCADQAQISLAPYLWQRTTGQPFCIGKAAVSIDGRIAAADGSSKWISSPEALADAHQLRAESQAIIIGAKTAQKDQPALTVRYETQKPLQPPLRVILDAKGILEVGGPLFDLNLGPTLMMTTDLCSEAVKRQWKRSGVDIEVVAHSKENRVDLHQLMQSLGKRGILQVLVEGGDLLSGFYREDLLNTLVLYQGNCLLGSSALPLFKTVIVPSISEAPRFILRGAQLLGNTVRLDYIVG